MSIQANEEQQQIPGTMVLSLIMHRAIQINQHASETYDAHVSYSGDFDFMEVRLLKGRKVEDPDDVRYFKRFDTEYINNDDEQYKEALSVLRDLEQIVEGLDD